MGVKGESNSQRAKPLATGEQLRLARLTLEGNSSDEDPSNIQRLIKKVIETTRCSQACAELALYDNDNDLAAAVDYILEHGSDVESWTEQKSKKEKKKDEDDRRPTRGQSSTRGRGVFSDRGTRGRSGGGGPSRGASRGAHASARGRGALSSGSGGSQRAQPSGPLSEASPKTVSADTDLSEENNDWKTGPMVFNRSDEFATATGVQPSPSVPVPSSSSSTGAPISFAAVAAAAARKEALRQLQTPSSQQPVEYHFEEPAPSQILSPDSCPIKDIFHSEPSVANPSDPEPVPTSVDDEEEREANVSPISPTIQDWTNQLKNDLGIGISESPRQQQQFAPVTVQSFAHAPAGVEFVTETAPVNLTDYQFGFVDPPTVADIPSNAPVASTESLFSTSRHTAAVAQKPMESERPTLSNGEFSLKTSSPSSVPHSYGPSNARSLSYADTSSVSYAPSDRGMGSAKQAAPVPHPQQQQQQQQQSAHQPQQMFPAQLPYGSYPYMNMNMYSPVTGVRAEDQYAALYASMPFGMGVDLSTILPQSTPMSQTGPTQQHPASAPHRSESHNLVDLNKYNSQGSRDASQQPSNVAPPPGFANPSFMPQPGLSSLLFQQQFPPHPYSFMMPNVGNSGRQMYTQEDERKSYDKMSGAKQAQATPPPHYHNGGYLSGLNKKPYNWNN